MNSIKKDDEILNDKYIFHSDKSLITYEVIKNVFINLFVVCGLLIIYFFYSKTIFLALIILVIIGAFFDIILCFKTIKYRKLMIKKDLLIIKKGNIFKKKYIIPIKNIYMITINNNIFFNKLNIVELKIRTLAENYSFNGLNKEDYNKCIKVLSEKTEIQHKHGDYDE
ncbi:PH domain-containing protein [Priestia megaterium]|uniref:PH domain-containing protein n=1 Tax=Priestia megaterium TaxID=1404 RepID=UPI00207B0CA6|nr:PH domain-containing protein [Priestia megaterium]USL39836.1 PH domain-containing protein [Priestia megaterium]